MNKCGFVILVATFLIPISLIRADDYVAFNDVYRFLNNLPYRVIALEEPISFTGHFTEHFQPVTINYCPSNGENKKNVLLKSLIQLKSNIIFTFVPTNDDSICSISNARRESLQFYAVNEINAPNIESVSILEESINQYGLVVKEYNSLVASKPDPGGVMQLTLSLALTALGVYGVLDPDELTKIAGALAIGVSSIGVVSSIEQIKRDRIRESRINELSLQLKLEF